MLLISILFILLAANINMDDLSLLMDWRAFALFGIVVLILRPLGVFLSTGDDILKMKEKLFISWVGPRGIVAAGIASLFGIKLTLDGVEGAEYITPLVFMVVLGTVLLNATTARLIAKALNVLQKSSNGILIIGANTAARFIAKYLQDNDRHVVLVDNNASSIKRAKDDGLEAFQANIYTDDLEDHFELLDMGYLMALTASADVNKYATVQFQKIFGEYGTFRILTAEEMKEKEDIPKEGLFSSTDDYLNLNEVVRDYPEIHEIEVDTKEEFAEFVGRLNQKDNSIPVFLKEVDGNLEIIPANMEHLEIEEGCKLVYLGESLERE